MSAKIIDGKAFAADLRARISGHVARLQAEHGLTPGLAVVLVGEDPASEVYDRNKGKQTRECGMASIEHKLPADCSEAQLLEVIASLNADAAIHGILVQLPLPKHLSAETVINAIAPEKDVDGFHISNAGMLATGQRGLTPCTPLGCLMLLRDHFGSLRGKQAVVIGRSNIVGKPMAQLLLNDDCTVTIVHRHTPNVAEITRQADIVVTAVGLPEKYDASYLKEGAVVIDVGINRIERDGRSIIVGDCDQASIAAVAGAFTPVPGGVGPMTIACLLANTVVAATRIHDLPAPADLTL